MKHALKAAVLVVLACAVTSPSWAASSKATKAKAPITVDKDTKAFFVKAAPANAFEIQSSRLAEKRAKDRGQGARASCSAVLPAVATRRAFLRTSASSRWRTREASP